MQVVKLHPLIGAEIRGVDLTKLVDQETQAGIRKAFEDNIVVCFRGQDLDDDAHVRATEIFGTTVIRRRPGNSRAIGGGYDTPFMMVTNIIQADGKPLGSFGDGEMWFHHDTSYYPEPSRATLLYSMKLPTWGGNTCFSNMYAAYERIPGKLRDKLEGKKVLQIHDYKRRERLNLDEVDFSQVRHQWQPIFITHPATGRKSLYISRLMSAKIEGFSHDESEDALNQLFDISENPEIIYEHEWGLGDLIIWDNWSSIHARKDFPRDQERLMRRTTTTGQALGF